MRAVIEGGILMVPFCLMVIAWVVCTVRFAIKPSRAMKGLVSLLLFPLGFLILAIVHWVFHWNAIYEQMELSGYPDEMQHIQRVLVTSRASLVIVSAAGLSLASSAAAFLLPLSNRRPNGQASDGDA